MPRSNLQALYTSLYNVRNDNNQRVYNNTFEKFKLDWSDIDFQRKIFGIVKKNPYHNRSIFDGDFIDFKDIYNLNEYFKTEDYNKRNMTYGDFLVTDAGKQYQPQGVLDNFSDWAEYGWEGFKYRFNAGVKGGRWRDTFETDEWWYKDNPNEKIDKLGRKDFKKQLEN